jgi:predicted nucleic acid-binding protein
MAYVAVLDANVLYPASLRDVLLRLAAEEFYDLRWSARILEETERNLAANGLMSSAQAERLVGVMREAFEGACADETAIAALEGAMTNDPKDRHVMAAAVAGEAQAVVTMNVSDFPEESAEPFGVEVMHPDEFLMVLFALNEGLVGDIVCRQAAALRRPPMSVAEVLDALRLTVPTFANAVAAEIEGREPA